MINKKYLFIILIFICIIFNFIGLNAEKFDPKLKWYTLETPHFSIHYADNEKIFAQKVANLAEEVHEKLSKELDWNPWEKTQIIIRNDDDAIGAFTNTPVMTINIYDLPYPSTYSDDGLRFLIAHEYTHLLHIDTALGVNKFFRKIFGRYSDEIFPPFFPNILQPMWLIEGMAMYQGRKFMENPHSIDVYYDAFLRTSVYENNLNNISQASTYNFTTWPGGHVLPYAYGMGMYEYIAQKYGNEKPKELSHQYAGQWIPYFVNYSANRVLGKDYYAIWKEYKENLIKKYNVQIDEIKKKGITSGTRLTESGYGIGHGLFSLDGEYIVYIENNEDEYPALKIMNSDGSEKRTLINGYIHSFAWAPDSKQIVYSRKDINDNFNFYYDLYLLDLTTKKESRLTEGLRTNFCDWAPDGEKIIFVSFQNGQYNLYQIDLKTKNIIPFTNSQDGTQYSGVKYSPDRKTIAVILTKENLPTDIYLFDLNGKIVKQVTNDTAIELRLAWGPLNQLYFTSTRNGVANIYVYREVTNYFRITNVIGAALLGNLSPDGKKILYDNLSSHGFDLYMIDEMSFVDIIFDYDSTVKFQTRPPKKDSYPEHKYSPFPSILPHFWFPLFVEIADEKGPQKGIVTLWQDALTQHAYDVYAVYGIKSERWAYNVGYMNNQFYPAIFLRASDTVVFYPDNLVYNYWERQEKASIHLSFPINPSINSFYQATIGYQKEKVNNQNPDPANIPIQVTGDMSSLSLSFGFANTKQYGFSISRTEGREISFSWEKMDPKLGSDFNLNKFLLKWDEFIPLFRKHEVLMFKLDAGLAFGDKFWQRAFQLDNSVGKFMVIGEEGSMFNPFVLRGYPIYSFRGQKAGVATLEYRFPVANIENGLGTLPFLLNRLHGAFFVDNGNAWDEKFLLDEVKSSVGTELRMDMTTGYYLPVTFRLGYAAGLNKKYNGEEQIYLGLDYTY